VPSILCQEDGAPHAGIQCYPGGGASDPELCGLPCPLPRLPRWCGAITERVGPCLALPCLAVARRGALGNGVKLTCFRILRPIASAEEQLSVLSMLRPLVYLPFWVKLRLMVL